MKLKRYSRQDFMLLCGGTMEAVRLVFPRLKVKKNGLFRASHVGDDLALAWDDPDARGPTPDLDLLQQRNLEAERGGWTWSPNKSATLPVLPFPFTAHQMAAFMLAGEGLELWRRFDYEAPAEFELALKRLGENGDDAREAMREAVALRVAADTKFGRDDKGVRQSAMWLLDGAPELTAPTDEAPLDLGLLATPEQLIAAFGAHTGMSAEWFDNLKDTPILLAARKVKGTSGRGRHTPPLFCPMAVMLWLLDRKRKKGHAFHNDDTAWRLLAQHFPKVYAKHSAADPREK